MIAFDTTGDNILLRLLTLILWPILWLVTEILKRGSGKSYLTCGDTNSLVIVIYVIFTRDTDKAIVNEKVDDRLGSVILADKSSTLVL